MARAQFQNAEIQGLRKGLCEIETARNRAIKFAHEIVHRMRNLAITALSTEHPNGLNILEEKCADAYEHTDENEALALEFGVVRNQVAEVEFELSSSPRSRITENGHLNQQLHKSEAARIAAIQFEKEMQLVDTIVVR